MGLWEKAKTELLDIIEWKDSSDNIMVHRFKRYEDEIKQGSQLIVRESQTAVFVNKGQIADVFKPGLHKLTTSNLPVLSTIMGWKYGFNSPFKAEVYFVNTKNFTNLKWGTKNPVILRDAEFGPIRLRSFGTFVIRVQDPSIFIREIVGTNETFTLDKITDQLRNLIVTRFSDLLATSKIPVLDLAINYDELSKFLTIKIASEFLEYGLKLSKLLVENISLPTEVEEALDKKSSMGIIGNLDKYMQFQSANALEAAAKNTGSDAASGIGMGMGFAMANQMGNKIMGKNAGGTKKSTQPPPLIPDSETMYYVAKNRKQLGPFTKNKIIHYIGTKAITKDTLIWTEDMEGWEKISKTSYFKAQFAKRPPPIP